MRLEVTVLEGGRWVRSRQLGRLSVAEVGAAAALSGLVIVAISINLQRILSFPQLPGRAAEMLIMLVGTLLASSFALMPGQAPRFLAAKFLAPRCS